MLSQEEFADIHASVLEAMSFVVLPVKIYRVRTTGRTFDPLYQEDAAGTEGWDLYADIHGSTRLKPDEEWLTRTGLRTNADLLVFIPRGTVTEWETLHGVPFAPKAGMELEFKGQRYSIKSEPRVDELPVLLTSGDVGQDYIGMVLMGNIKADTSR